MIFEGACHCGAVRVAFETQKSPDEIQVRVCQCSFCRRRGGKTVSDPDGRLEFRCDPGAMQRYRFGTATADFVICRVCAGYLGVVQDIDGELFGVLNVVGADIAALANRPGEPMDYDAEALAGRMERRRSVWSPAVVLEEARG